MSAFAVTRPRSGAPDTQVPDAAGLQAIREALAANPFLALDGTPSQERPVDVIVPVYDAADDVIACVQSVARHTLVPFRLVLMNDGSTDPRIGSLLDAIRGAAPGLVVVDRPDNRGFVRTVNEGFALSPDSDVIVLNSDTIVSPRWLEKMTALARSRADVATVTPLTNNGTICSIPVVLEDNELPAGYDVDGFAALVEAASIEVFPEAPTGVGFCMLITRRSLQTVGAFDAAAFGRGYGEENDFCQRALRAGLVNLIADNTFVYHKGRASFGARGAELTARNLEIVTARHPAYDADVTAFCRDHPLRRFHEDLRLRIAAERGAQHAIRLRVLHVLHHDGGTEKHARELAALEDPGVLSYVLRSDGRTLEADEYYRGRVFRTLRFPLPAVIEKYGPLRDPGYRDALTVIGRSLDIDLIHVHHLMYNTLDIADVAAALGVPYVMTLHDYHTICPMYTLLTPDGLPCGACTGGPGGGSAEACMEHAGQPPSYLAAYQSRMHHFLDGAARLFAPNERAREIIAGRYPLLAPAISVVEHGHVHHVRLEDGGAADAPAAFDGSSDLNVAVIGSLDVHKGAAVLRNLLKANRRAGTTFHFYGTSADPAIVQALLNQPQPLDGSTFVYHGPYESKDIVRMLVDDRIHVGLQLSIWPETFSYTLSEFADAGVPIIAGRLGAQGERIERCRLGWTVDDIHDPSGVLAVLDEIIRRPASHHEAARGMRRGDALVPIDVMWGHYLDVYRSLIQNPKAPTKTGDGRRYLAFLATRPAGPEADNAATSETLKGLERELAGMRERLRSPRHRIADTLANAIQKIPLVWPVVRRVTEAVLRLEQKRR